MVGGVDALAAADLTVPGTGETLDVLRGVERQIRRLQGVSVRLVGQVEQRGLVAPAGATSTVALLQQVLQVGAGDAADRVRLSRAVCATVGLTGAPVEPQLSGLADAVAAGAVGQRQAARLAATFDKFPSTISQDLRDSVERFLVVQTQQLPPVVFGRVARQIELMADPDGPPEERDAHEKMEFRFGHRRDNGLTPCYGLLDDLTTEALRTAFGAICAPAATRNRETHPTDPAQPHPPGRPRPPGRPADTADPAERTRTAPTATVDADDPPAPTRTPDDTTAEPSAGDPTDDPTGTGDHPCPAGEEPAGPDEEPPGPDEEPAGPGEEPAGEGCDPSNTPPVWRPSRIPEHWAPLGTVATDYPPPLISPHPTPPHPEPPHPEPPHPEPPHPGPPEDRRSRPTRQAHALTIIINKFLELGCAPTQGGERPHLLVTVTEQSLRDRTRSGTLGYGDHLPIHHIRMLACDARIIPAVLGGHNETLDMGRASRTFNAACRRAMASSVGRCNTPADVRCCGCRRRRN